jgi:hypothetical protein
LALSLSRSSAIRQRRPRNPGLKRGARLAVELLANEAVHYLRTVAKEKVFGEDAADAERLACQLTAESLTYLYRLLFLFFVEAQGAEMGVVATGSASYREGYSLESLRDLELVALTTVEARDGYYIYHSLEQLFQLVHQGFPHTKTARTSLDGFEMAGLRSPLFDAGRTPLFKQVKFRNGVLQKVIEHLSLTEEGKKRRKDGRGRISYANLGINQLGSVYEGLLSYSGFFAREDLYEVQAAGEANDDGEASEARVYFVTRGDLDKYKKDEIVRTSDGKPLLHRKGTFVFRLAGRDREKNASYFTPEVLTRCLTKYTLKERLIRLSADEILNLTICEPAMGSGAFLIEAIGQLADAYLERKQLECAEILPSAAYAIEKQKVKLHFAVHNAYGVDLNPAALELAKVSLTLATLHPGGKAPFFDLGLATGNSLIGTRREVFCAETLRATGSPGTERAPTRVPLGTTRPADGVYHFLVGDSAMAPFDGEKVACELEPEATSALKEWRKEFTKPWSDADVKTLERLSLRVDVLWKEHVTDRLEQRQRMAQPLALWGQPARATLRWKSVEECEELAAMPGREAAPGRRLAAVMDAWCALWFWPVQNARLLPERHEWLAEVEALLEGSVNAQRVASAAGKKRRALARDIAKLYRFHHWELAFPEIFMRGGFDVILGNPPWIKVEWNEQALLSEFEPRIDVHRMSASDVARERHKLLNESARVSLYLAELEERTATRSFLNARANYRLLQGVQTNIYKCFQTRMWELNSSAGKVGLIYQPGILDDPRGGSLRRALALRVHLLARFKNSLMLFDAIHHLTQYVLVVSGASRETVEFLLVTNLLHPSTLDASFAHDGHGAVPGIKTEDGAWDLRGHRARVVDVNVNTLALFARLYDEGETPPLEARVPIVHSGEILSVLEKLANAPHKLADLEGQFYATVHFDETNQQKDGTIRRETRAVSKPEDWVVQGPHFFVGTPFNKTPNEGCHHNQDYSPIDLETIPDDYLPRTNYVRACSPIEYIARTPVAPWGGRRVTDFFRHIHREMIGPTSERTLITSILCPGPSHINTVFGVAFLNAVDLVRFSSMASTLVADFFVKTTGMSHANLTLTSRLPLSATRANGASLFARTLRLNCLTSHYAPLWNELFTPAFRDETWTKDDARLGSWKTLTPAWARDCALRTPYARRQALVEMDALAALELALTADELCLLYQVQFPVLQQYERETFYDRRGRIAFTVNKGLTGVGLARKEWEQIRHAQAGAKLPSFAKEYEAPFDRCDREADMRNAYEQFTQRLGITAKKVSATRIRSAPPPHRGLAKTVSSQSTVVSKKVVSKKRAGA